MMDNTNYSTEHRKGQHLTTEERYEIEIRKKDGWSIYRIAKELGRAYNTIKNEIDRGTVELYNGKVHRYKAKVGEVKYKANRQNCRCQYKRLKAARFLTRVTEEFKVGHSLDSAAGRAKEFGDFSPEETVCTKTLYNYVDKGLLNIKNIDLPEKLSRNTKRAKVRENRRILGDSIDLRDKNVELREGFGDWEVDTVLGCKGKDEACIVTLVERKTRMCFWIKARNHTADAVQSAIVNAIASFGDKRSEVFKTITADNGSEFARLSELKGNGIGIYFTHPYCSWEKGTNERHNRILRRFIRKGESINRYSQDDIAFCADWANNLPRKILHYYTPEELFEEELDRIYAALPECG